MGDRTKEKILEVVEIAILLTLIVVRFFISSDENVWINVLNYFGLILAFSSLYLEIRTDCSAYKKFDFVTGIFVIGFVVLSMFAGLILTEIITLNTKASDIIMLVTLLITLPMRLYKSIIAEALKD